MSGEWADFAGAVAWPFVALIALAYAVSKSGQRLLRPLLRRLRSFSAGGIAFELTEQAAIATKTDVQGTIQDYSDRLRDQFERLENRHNVRHHLVEAVEDLLEYEEITRGKVRAAVHIRDALYAGALYQLTDYWPGGKGADRRFSTGFGILGRAWRLRKSQYEARVPKWTDKDDAGLEKLVTRWGMTREQATSSAAGRQTFLCILLGDEKNAPVGVLYLDALHERAFIQGENEDAKAVTDRFEQNQHVKDLGHAVGCVYGEIAALGPGLRLLHNDE